MAQQDIQTSTASAETSIPIEKNVRASEETDAMAAEKAHMKSAKSADKMAAYADATAMPIDEQTNKRLLRKIDLHILPWLCVLYILQYLDKGV